MLILGLNAFHADAAAALVDGSSGKIVAAVAEERLSRVKHAGGFPWRAVEACLRMAGATPSDLTEVAVARDSFASLFAKGLYALRHLTHLPQLAGPRLENRALVGSIRELMEDRFRGAGLNARFHRIEHHLAHAASAFLPSPFDRAAILTLDGFGDFSSMLMAVGEGSRIRPLARVRFPHSLGALYTAVSQFLGFDRCGEESKVMGLAAYGTDSHRDLFNRIVRLLPGGGFELDLRYFRHPQEGFDYTFTTDGTPCVNHFYSPALAEALGPPRVRGEELTQRERDVACSLQACLERAYIHVLHDLHRRTGLKNLTLAGGVTLNCSANGRILRDTPFRRIFIQPAAGDDGTALGAALLSAVGRREMSSAALGPESSDTEIENALQRPGLRAQRLEEDELLRRTAQRINEGAIVGWFQGRMEWGPRALGNRSILTRAADVSIRDTLNARIKHRESFRPFAPSILAERLDDYFESAGPSPFMLQAFRVRPARRDQIPAVVHEDGTGRVQTVTEEGAPLLHRLLKEYEKISGCPVVLNTSFNDDEPIVCTPDEAVDCFLRTKMDVLAIGPYWCESDKLNH